MSILQLLGLLFALLHGLHAALKRTVESPKSQLSHFRPIYVVFLGTIIFAIYVPSAILWLPKQVMPQAVGCFKNPSGSGYICPS